MHTDATLRAIAGVETSFTLPRELITTDRVLQRWAVSIGAGLPSDEWDDQPRPKPPLLPDDVAIVVDQCVLRAPGRTRELIGRWYKTPEPVEVISRKLRISDRQVYRHHTLALHFMRWRFEGAGNDQLCRMIRAIET